jgi:hypothetical protein
MGVMGLPPAWPGRRGAALGWGRPAATEAANAPLAGPGCRQLSGMGVRRELDGLLWPLAHGGAKGRLSRG